jgi:cytidylate kinase
MPGVTISAGFGAAGSIVAPAVAKELGFESLDRAISATVAARLQVSVAEAVDASTKQSFGTRFLRLLAPLGGGVLGAGTDAGPGTELLSEDETAEFRVEAEKIMMTAMSHGAVILGRAGSAAFRDAPGILRVRLFGDLERRIVQGAGIEGLTVERARELQPKVDKARALYMRRLYRMNVDDPDLYHLQIDSTTVPPVACAQVIADAYRAFSTADHDGAR